MLAQDVVFNLEKLSDNCVVYSSSSSYAGVAVDALFAVHVALFFKASISQ